jgi:hypothetical protein
MEQINRGESPELEMSIEEWILTKLGYSHCLDTTISPDSTVTGRNFLEAYGESPHRQSTEDILEGFKDMDPSDPDYETARAYILRFLEAQFGPSVSETNDAS